MPIIAFLILATTDLSVFQLEIRPRVGFGWICQTRERERERERSRRPVPVVKPGQLQGQPSRRPIPVIPIPPTVQIPSLVFNRMPEIGARATFGRRWSSVEVGGRSSTFAGAVREREREREREYYEGQRAKQI
jgi:hypothetical protein